MEVDDRDIKDTVIEALRSDPVVSDYVKSFSTGEMGVSRKIFPFIAVGNLECDISPRTIGWKGYDAFTYTLEIRSGTRSLVPGEAFAGERGILQLCEDIVNVVRPSDFGGIFTSPVDVLGVYPGFRAAS